jgi:tetratricopeptide (TPR) repeat protein
VRIPTVHNVARLRSARIAAGLVVATLAGAQPTLAQLPAGDAAAVTSRVEVLSQEGVLAYKDGRYREALARFKAALALQPVANLLYNIARTHEKLGERAEAVTYYERFDRAPDADGQARENARERVRVLRQELAAQQAADPLTGGGTTNGTDTGTITGGGEIADDHSMATAGWVLVGVGAAAAITGGVLGGLASGAQSDFDASTTLNEKRTLRDDAKSLALGSDVTIGIGAGALVAGVILVVLDATGSASESSGSGLSIAPAVSTSGAGVSAGLTF